MPDDQTMCTNRIRDSSFRGARNCTRKATTVGSRGQQLCAICAAAEKRGAARREEASKNRKAIIAYENRRILEREAKEKKLVELLAALKAANLLDENGNLRDHRSTFITCHPLPWTHEVEVPADHGIVTFFVPRERDNHE